MIVCIGTGFQNMLRWFVLLTYCQWCSHYHVERLNTDCSKGLLQYTHIYYEAKGIQSSSWPAEDRLVSLAHLNTERRNRLDFNNNKNENDVSSGYTQICFVSISRTSCLLCAVFNSLFKHSLYKEDPSSKSSLSDVSSCIQCNFPHFTVFDLDP